MRRQPESQRREEAEIERLLTQLRRQVAQLRRLELAPRDGSDLTTSRQTVAELRWQLARLVANQSDGGQSVAA
ncbi:MAG TPA: hypothetical protein VIM33_16185 [Gaiellaceae bacterium]|jgi:hypothetical protein